MKRLKLSELSLDCHCYDSPEQMYPEIADEDIVPARYRVVHGIDDNPDICALPPLPTGLALLSASTRFPAQVYHDMTRLSIADRLAGLSATKDDAKVLLPFQASLSRKLQECLISAYKHRTYGYYYRLADDTTIISRAEPISTSVQDMSIIGTSGSGKSSAVGMELMRYPKGILHKHQGFSYIQIPFLLAVAHRGTDIKSLYIDCARQIDGIIDSNSFYESQMIKLNTVPRMESFLVQLIQLFHIGAILIDEIQLVVNVRTKMFDHLLSITASCGVALVIIGTEHALKDQMKNEWFCRRFTHLGRICSDIPLTDSSTMCSIISQIWEMQWTKVQW